MVGWFRMERPTKMHDFGASPFQETSLCIKDLKDRNCPDSQAKIHDRDHLHIEGPQCAYCHPNILGGKSNEKEPK